MAKEPHRFILLAVVFVLCIGSVSAQDSRSECDSSNANSVDQVEESPSATQNLENDSADEEIPYAVWASVIASVCAVIGLFYAGYQFSAISRTTRQSMYVSWLEKYLRLKELVLEHPELDDIYRKDISPCDLSPRQRHYIFSIIAFCEAIFQTGQVQSFPKEVPGSSWENYIVHQLSTPTIKLLWSAATSSPDCDFTPEFVSWVNPKLGC